MRTSRLFWLASVLFGLAAAALVALLVQRYQRTERVVVARVALAPWTLVTPGDITLATRPAVGLLPGTLLSPAVALGRFTATGLVPGQAVTVANLSAVGLGSAYDAQLAALDGITRHCTAAAASPPPASASAHALARCGRYVALPLPLTADQGYDLIHAGSRVDLWAALPTASGVVSQTVVQGVLVMALLTPGSGMPLVGAAGAVSTPAAQGSGIAVLAVTPAQAGRILLAGKLGALTVALQALGAAAPAAPSPVTLTTLLSGQAPLTTPPAQAGTLPAVPQSTTAAGRG